MSSSTDIGTPSQRWDYHRRRSGGLADILTGSDSSDGGEFTNLHGTPTAASPAGGSKFATTTRSSPTSRTNISALSPIKKKPPAEYNATSMQHSPYVSSPADKAFAASADAPKYILKSERKKKPHAQPPAPNPEAEAAAKEAAERRQRLLAQLATTGATQPSSYMAQLMGEIEALDVAGEDGVQPIGALGGSLGGVSSTHPDITRLQALQAEMDALESRQNPAASSTAGLSIDTNPLAAFGALGGLGASNPVPQQQHSPPAHELLNIEALSHYLTPAQAAQLHLYPQLLIQAVAAAKEQAARLAAGEIPEPDLPAAPTVPAFMSALKRDVVPDRHAAAPAFAHRTTSGQGWDDSFASPTHARKKKKDEGTFGEPPPLVFPGAPGHVKQKSPWKEKERKAAAAMGRGLPPMMTTSNPSSPSPQHSRTHSPTRSHEQLLSPSGIQLTPLHSPSEEKMQSYPSGSLSISPLKSPSFGLTMSQPFASTAGRTVTQVIPQPPPQSAAQQKDLTHAPAVKSDLAQSLFDLSNYFEHHAAREQMLHVSSMASVALQTIAAEHGGTAGTNVAGAHTIQSQWDMNPYIEHALGKYLVYFSAAREKYHLTQPAPDGLAVSTGALPVALEKRPAYPLNLHTSQASLAWENYGWMEEDILLPGSAAQQQAAASGAGGIGIGIPSSSKLESDLVSKTLLQQKWFSSGFTTGSIAQQIQEEDILTDLDPTTTVERAERDESLVFRGEDTPAVAPTFADASFLSPLTSPLLSAALNKRRSAVSPLGVTPAAAGGKGKNLVVPLQLKNLLPETTEDGAFAGAHKGSGRGGKIVPRGGGLNRVQADLIARTTQPVGDTRTKYDAVGQSSSMPPAAAAPYITPAQQAAQIASESFATLAAQPLLPSPSPSTINQGPPPLHQNLPVMSVSEVLALREIEAARLEALVPLRPNEDILDFLDLHARASELATRAAMQVANLIEDGVLAPGEAELQMSLIFQRLQQQQKDANTILIASTEQAQGPYVPVNGIDPSSTSQCDQPVELQSTSTLIAPHDPSFSPRHTQTILTVPPPESAPPTQRLKTATDSTAPTAQPSPGAPVPPATVVAAERQGAGGYPKQLEDEYPFEAELLSPEAILTGGDKNPKEEEYHFEEVKETEKKTPEEEYPFDDAHSSFSPSELAEQEAAAVKIQSVLKGRQVRKQVAEAKMVAAADVAAQENAAATKIQAVAKGRKVRKQVAQAAAEAAAEIAEQEQAAIKIQSVTKGRKVRKQMAVAKAQAAADLAEQEQAAVKIQAVAKGRKARKQIAQVKAEATATAAAANELAEQEQAAVKIQAVMMGRQARKMVAETRAQAAVEIAEQEQAAIKIQSVMKGRKVRKQVAEAKMVAAAEISDQEQAAIKIQAVAKGRKVRKQVAEAKKEAASELAEQEHAAVKIQAVMKGRKVRRETGLLKGKQPEDSLVAPELSSIPSAIETAAAVKIQSQFRGHAVRSKQRQLRPSIAAAAASSVSSSTSPVPTHAGLSSNESSLRRPDGASDPSSVPMPMLLDMSDPEQQDRMSQLLSFVGQRSYADVTEMFSQGVAVQSADLNGVQPIHAAAINGDKKMLKLCLRWGADIHALTNEGDTPLHLLKAFNHDAVAEYLISKGADIHRRNRNGLTPIDSAPAEGQTER